MLLLVVCQPFACVLTLVDVLGKLFGLSSLLQTSCYVQFYCSLYAIAVLRACQKYVKSVEMPFGMLEEGPGDRNVPVAMFTT